MVDDGRIIPPPRRGHKPVPARGCTPDRLNDKEYIMNGFLKLLGAIEVMREAFDDSKHPTFSSTSVDDEEFRVDDSDSNHGGRHFYSSSSSSGGHTSCHHWSGYDDGEATEEDDSSDSTADTVATCIRLGRVMRLVDRGNYIAACKR